MNTRDYDRFDTFCVRCGHGICFEVGWGSVCPSCGENYEYTDKQLAENKLKNETSHRKAVEYIHDKTLKIMFLQSLKLGRSMDEQRMLDEIMNDVDSFEANAIRYGDVSLYDMEDYF